MNNLKKLVGKGGVRIWPWFAESSIFADTSPTSFLLQRYQWCMKLKDIRWTKVRSTYITLPALTFDSIDSLVGGQYWTEVKHQLVSSHLIGACELLHEGYYLIKMGCDSKHSFHVFHVRYTWKEGQLIYTSCSCKIGKLFPTSPISLLVSKLTSPLSPSTLMLQQREWAA